MDSNLEFRLLNFVAFHNIRHDKLDVGTPFGLFDCIHYRTLQIPTDDDVKIYRFNDQVFKLKL